MSDSPYNNALEFSLKGSTWASTGTGSFGILQCTQETVFHSVGAENITGISSLVGLTIPAGERIYGKITSFSTSNGAVVCAHNRY